VSPNRPRNGRNRSRRRQSRAPFRPAAPFLGQEGRYAAFLLPPRL
jgi:hypothetical protein